MDLSYWKFQHQPKPNFWTEDKILLFKIASFLVESIMLSVCTILPVPTAAKAPLNNEAVTTMFNGW